MWVLIHFFLFVMDRPECEAQVKGFAGAAYKKFPTQDEANHFIAQKRSNATLSAVSTGLVSWIFSLADFGRSIYTLARKIKSVINFCRRSKVFCAFCISLTILFIVQVSLHLKKNKNFWLNIVLSRIKISNIFRLGKTSKHIQQTASKRDWFWIGASSETFKNWRKQNHRLHVKYQTDEKIR